MRRLSLALVSLGSVCVVNTACAANHTPPTVPPIISPEMRQLLRIRGALADYAKTEIITILRDKHGKSVSFRFNPKGD
jgi:hypothetical protein